MTEKTDVSLSSSLLEDGQLPGFEEGLDHPHGKDVHFSVHHDFLFLQQICRDGQAERQVSVSRLLVVSVLKRKTQASPSIFVWNSSSGRSMTSTNSTRGRKEEGCEVIGFTMEEGYF